jgi:hypothetical protein
MTGFATPLWERSSELWLYWNDPPGGSNLSLGGATTGGGGVTGTAGVITGTGATAGAGTTPGENCSPGTTTGAPVAGGGTVVCKNGFVEGCVERQPTSAVAVRITAHGRFIGRLLWPGLASVPSALKRHRETRAETDLLPEMRLER